MIIKRSYIFFALSLSAAFALKTELKIDKVDQGVKENLKIIEKVEIQNKSIETKISAQANKIDQIDERLDKFDEYVRANENHKRDQVQQLSTMEESIVAHENALQALNAKVEELKINLEAKKDKKPKNYHSNDEYFKRNNPQAYARSKSEYYQHAPLFKSSDLSEVESMKRELSKKISAACQQDMLCKNRVNWVQGNLIHQQPLSVFFIGSGIKLNQTMFVSPYKPETNFSVDLKKEVIGHIKISIQGDERFSELPIDDFARKMRDTYYNITDRKRSKVHSNELLIGELMRIERKEDQSIELTYTTERKVKSQFPPYEYTPVKIIVNISNAS